MHDKAQIRQEMRLLRRNGTDVAQASRIICRHVLGMEAFRKASVVAGYLPLRWEADVTPLLEAALAAGKTLLLPRIEAAPHMTMRRVGSLAELVPGPMGLMEPAVNAQMIPPEEIDLVLTPLEALTHEGLRLGKGGGYYDCYLAKTRALCLGVVLPWQWRDTLPASPWDRPLDAAACTEGIEWFNLNGDRE